NENVKPTPKPGIGLTSKYSPPVVAVPPARLSAVPTTPATERPEKVARESVVPGTASTPPGVELGRLPAGPPMCHAAVKPLAESNTPAPLEAAGASGFCHSMWISCVALPGRILSTDTQISALRAAE